jgi:hypothetical protein
MMSATINRIPTIVQITPFFMGSTNWARQSPGHDDTILMNRHRHAIDDSAGGDWFGRSNGARSAPPHLRPAAAARQHAPDRA